MKILLLEDDLILNEIIQEHSIEKEHSVISVFTGDDAQDAIYSKTFDILLLDVNVPNINGFELLNQLRKNGIKTPAIFITSANMLEDIEKGFESGCDDYIKKPFDLEELDQRILKLCRQFLIEQNDKIRIDDNIFFESQSCQVYVNDKIVNLAQKERDILKYFCTHKNRVVSSDELLQNIWAYDEMPTDATIRVYIKNLREIIGKDKITTIRGIGYRFE